MTASIYVVYVASGACVSQSKEIHCLWFTLNCCCSISPFSLPSLLSSSFIWRVCVCVCERWACLIRSRSKLPCLCTGSTLTRTFSHCLCLFHTRTRFESGAGSFFYSTLAGRFASLTPTRIIDLTNGWNRNRCNTMWVNGYFARSRMCYVDSVPFSAHTNIFHASQEQKQRTLQRMLDIQCCFVLMQRRI